LKKLKKASCFKNGPYTDDSKTSNTNSKPCIEKNSFSQTNFFDESKQYTTNGKL